MTIPIFINDRRVLVAPGTTAGAAAGLADPAVGSGLADGMAYLTDGRGIRMALDLVITAGAIIRVVKTARRAADADA